MKQSTITAHQPPSTVVGDGTTHRSRLRARFARWRALIITIIAILAFGALSALIKPAGNSIPLHPDNAEENGARALVQILEQRGVSVSVTSSVPTARKRAGPNTTVLAYDAYFVDGDAYDEMLDAGANLVVVDPELDTLRRLTPGLSRAQYSWNDEQNATEAVPADCDDPHAQAAEVMAPAEQGFSRDPDSDVSLCFSVNGVAPYAASPTGQVRMFSEPDVFMNENLASAGNAALTIRALGERERVVWLIPSFTQSGTESAEAAMLDFLPPWFNTVLVLAGFITVYLAFWRGRRFGRLVTEPLPVQVRAAESTIGLGRMYRRANELDHAARALRAGVALRCAQRLGISPAAPGTAIASAIAHAVNRSYEEVSGLLLGGAPRTESDLITLAQLLDHLESEVHAS